MNTPLLCRQKCAGTFRREVEGMEVVDEDLHSARSRDSGDER